MTEPVAHATRAHASLGASAAHRWMVCPGSVRLSKTVPTPPTSAFAAEGTAAHELADRVLTARLVEGAPGVHPLDFCGEELEGYIVTEDMALATAAYTDYCTAQAAAASGPVWIEKRFDLAALTPPAPMYGTGDCAIYDGAAETLEIIDLKFGRGVVVEAVGNKQLRYYALGALLAIEQEYRDRGETPPPVREIVMTIVQPRADHPDGRVRSDRIAYHDLVEWASDLLAAAEATMHSHAPLVPGSHCRFCPAAGVCTAQYRAAQAIAQTEFGVVPLAAPPAPETMDEVEFLRVLEQLPLLEQWIKAMYGAAEARLRREGELPGWKYVQKRATRKWGDPERVIATLAEQGFNDEEIYTPRVLKSVAQIEKLVGKTVMAEALAEVVTKESSGVVMVRASDARPAVTLSPGDDFAAIPAGED